MKTTSRILVALCLALSPLACASNVVGTSTGGEGTSTGDNPTGCGPAPGEPTTPVTTPPTAIAILASQIDGFSGVDPDTLYVMVGSPVPACADPFASSAQCGPTFSVSIGIPPQLQQPGTLQLSSSQLISTFSEVGPASSATPGDCPAGGGSFADGTIEILSIDATQIVFTLSGTMMFAGEGVPDEVANGTYTAARCP